MMHLLVKKNLFLHHRIGGLEICALFCSCHCALHHRIGGLENNKERKPMQNVLHHRIGGLEIMIVTKAF